MKAILITLTIGGATLWLSNADAQVFKCNVGGQQVYQQQPCAETGSKGKEVKIYSGPASGDVPAAKPAPSTLPAGPPATMPTTQIDTPVAPLKSALEMQADQCLDWYRPLLRDPRGAYHRDASRNKDVLSLTIHATNGYGGYVTRSAACEFRGARLEDAWTKMQAKRLGW